MCGILLWLLCISPVTNDVEHLLMCLLAIGISLAKCVLKPSAYFKIGLFVFLLLNRKLIVAFICISLMADYAKHLFMYLTACRSSLEKCLFRFFACLKKMVTCLTELQVFFISRSLIRYLICKIFLPFFDYSFSS